jgi:hypothetical protein
MMRCRDLIAGQVQVMFVSHRADARSGLHCLDSEQFRSGPRTCRAFCGML